MCTFVNGEQKVTTGSHLRVNYGQLRGSNARSLQTNVIRLCIFPILEIHVFTVNEWML